MHSAFNLALTYVSSPHPTDFQRRHPKVFHCLERCPRITSGQHFRNDASPEQNISTVSSKCTQYLRHPLLHNNISPVNCLSVRGQPWTGVPTTLIFSEPESTNQNLRIPIPNFQHRPIQAPFTDYWQRISKINNSQTARELLFVNLFDLVSDTASDIGELKLNFTGWGFCNSIELVGKN